MKSIKYEPGENPNPGVIVAVFCDAESHAGKVSWVGTFTRRDGSHGWSSVPLAPNSKQERWPYQELHEDHRLTDEERTSLPHPQADPRWRVRYDLHCHLCGDSVPVRGENLSPVLDILAEHADAWEIELTAIRARLSR